MKFLKGFLIVLLLFVAIPLIVALFTKKEYHVERKVIINKPKTEVFEFIKQLKNQGKYSKWALIDPTMKKTYHGTDGTVGFVYAWDSNHEQVGSGEQEIIKIVDGERIDYELRFIKPFESNAPAYMATETLGDNQTKVKWGFDGHMDYPMNLMLLFMDFEKLVGDDLQSGLDKLKEILENK